MRHRRRDEDRDTDAAHQRFVENARDAANHSVMRAF
jgi:hypothetical protein